MLDDGYLVMGLDALSRAHERDYFRDGHLGASVMAAYHLCHENGLDERTQNAIKSHIDRELRDDALFLPAPSEPPDDSLLESLLEVLAAGIDELREVGHNVIFAAAALKAFQRLPDTVTPYRVNGVSRLIDCFVATQDVSVAEDDGIPEVGDEARLIEFIFHEYLRTLARYAGRGQGWTGHLLTFGHAVIELSRLGYPQLAARAHEAFRVYIAMVRGGPREIDRQISDHPPSSRTPLDYDYWERRKPVRPGLGHAFKYPYSFYNLLSGLRDPRLRERSLAESYKIF